MTKQDILDYFKDINEAYNDCSKYDSLSRMLDELLEKEDAKHACKECQEWECDGCPFKDEQT